MSGKLKKSVFSKEAAIILLILGSFLFSGCRLIGSRKWEVFIYDRGKYWENHEKTNEKENEVPLATLHVPGYSSKEECLKALFGFTKEDSPYYKTGPQDDYVAMCQRGCREDGWSDCREVCYLDGRCL